MNNYFPIALETAVVTSDYVTKKGMPVLCAWREADDEEGEIWQFHCGNDDYSMEHLQLVRLETILRLDDTLSTLSQLPLGYCATRESVGAEWRIEALPS